MGEAAVAAAKAIGYSNAGTVEFILDQSGNFYFLEVNTRLQVEHPVTEMVTHRDLVRAQLAVALGGKLPFTQVDLKQEGHAIECRIYAEDAARGFLPSIGVLERYIEPRGPGIRIDTGVAQGSEVSVYYDPMLAKLVCWARTREEAIDKTIRALDRYVIMGVTTNVAFLRDVLAHPEFRAGNLHTHFLEQHAIAAAAPGNPPTEALIAAAVAARLGRAAAKASLGAAIAAPGPWESAGRWRGP